MGKWGIRAGMRVLAHPRPFFKKKVKNRLVPS